MLAALALILLGQAGIELAPAPQRAGAQPAPDLPPIPAADAADDAPTAFACTWDVVLRGDSCAFEGVAAKGDAATNARLALAALSRACAEATADEHLQRACEDDGEQIARSPGCARDDVRVADPSGHLVQKAAGCAEALRRVVARTRRKAALDADCLGEDCPAPMSDEPPPSPKAIPAKKRAPMRKSTSQPPNTEKT